MWSRPDPQRGDDSHVNQASLVNLVGPSLIKLITFMLNVNVALSQESGLIYVGRPNSDKPGILFFCPFFFLPSFFS